MSRTSKAVFRNILIVMAGSALCALIGLNVKKIVASDPMKRYKEAKPVDESRGVVMTNFDWKAYNKSELVAQAHVKEAVVGRDRGSVMLTAVSSGKFFDNKKQAFGFEAQNAVYYNDLNTLAGSGKARVFNEQMDLATTEFRYDPKTKSVIVPTSLSGKLQGGDLKADKLTYKLEDKSFEVNGIRWSGMIAQDGTKRRWSFGPQDKESKLNSKTVGSKTTYTKLRATDGEIIILADGGEYDRDSDVLIAKGNVKYFGSDANLVCNEVTVYRKDKRALLVGAVDMLVKAKQGGKAEEVKIPPVNPIVPDEIKNNRPPAPKGDDAQSDQQKQIRNGDNIRDYPIAVTAQRIEYWYGKGNRHANITGSPQARQELNLGSWRMVWADSAAYDGEKETLFLKSKGETATVRMLNSLGDDLHADSVLVSTKEGDDMMDASGVTMDMTLDDPDLPDKTKGTKGGTGEKPPPSLSGPIGDKKRGR